MGCQIHNHAQRMLCLFRFKCRGDGVKPFIAVHNDGRGKVGIKAGEGGMGAVGIEARERQLIVNEVLGQDACDNRFADAAFFATDEIE